MIISELWRFIVFHICNVLIINHLCYNKVHLMHLIFQNMPILSTLSTNYFFNMFFRHRRPEYSGCLWQKFFTILLLKVNKILYIKVRHLDLRITNRRITNGRLFVIRKFVICRVMSSFNIQNFNGFCKYFEEGKIICYLSLFCSGLPHLPRPLRIRDRRVITRLSRTVLCRG